MNIILPDIERKVFRIIINHTKTKDRLPTVQELMIWTGRSKQSVIKVLHELDKKQLIKFDSQSLKINIFKGWY